MWKKKMGKNINGLRRKVNEIDLNSESILFHQHIKSARVKTQVENKECFLNEKSELYQHEDCMMIISDPLPQPTPAGKNGVYVRKKKAQTRDHRQINGRSGRGESFISTDSSTSILPRRTRTVMEQ